IVVNSRTAFCENRHAQRHCFEDGNAMPFVPRQRDKEFPVALMAVNVGHRTSDPDGVRQLMFPNKPLDFADIGVVCCGSHQFQSNVWPLASKYAEGLNQLQLSFSRSQLSNKSDTPRIAWSWGKSIHRFGSNAPWDRNNLRGR